MLQDTLTFSKIFIAVSENNDILKKNIFYFGRRVSVGTLSQSGCGVEKWL